MADPLLSVVLELYNEDVNALVAHSDTVDALYRQDFPLEQSELVVIANSRQICDFKELHPDLPRFAQVSLIVAQEPDCHYWTLKNLAAKKASGDYLTFADSDVSPDPRWLSAIVKGLNSGADLAVGPSQFRTRVLHSDSPWMLAAALPTWGFVLSPARRGEPWKAGSLMSHNFAMRRQWLLDHPFREAARSFNSSLLFFELVRAGARTVYQTEQRVTHAMSLQWWFRAHFRRGWETYCGRELDQDWPRLPIIHRFPLLEPPVLRMGLVCRDARHWFRFSSVLAVNRLRAVLLFPLVVALSFAARTAEMVGMYAALIAPRATQHHARF